MAKQAEEVKYSVPQELQGKDVWMDKKYELDKCSQKELAFLHSKGIGIQKAS